MASINAYTAALSRAETAHMLKRVTFGPTKSQIDQYTGSTAQQILDTVIPSVAPTALTPPTDPETGTAWQTPDGDGDPGLNIDTLKGWWLHQMRISGLSIVEKMTFFLHTHFTTISSVVESGTALYYQNALFRHYALGNFKELSKKICLDNAMLIFLNGNENEVGLPQENFGREFLELYTIGKGNQVGPGDYTNYTEQDVQAAAKVLSGYKNDRSFSTLDPDTNIPTGGLKLNGAIANRHDATSKTFSARFQNTVITPNDVINGQATEAAALDELDQLVELIFSQEETAKHIARKLYRFFVFYEITDEIEQDIIVPLANTIRTNDFELIPALQQLLQCEHFFDRDNGVVVDDVQGALIKPPIDLTLGVMRFFEVEFPDEATSATEFYETTYGGVLSYLFDQGLDLLEPFEVAGYAAYHQYPEFNRNWISANYLGRRYQFIDLLINGVNKSGDPLNIVLDPLLWVENTANIATPQDASEIVQAFVDYLLPEIITQERFDYFLDFVLLDELSPVNWTNEWNDYETSGDDAAVRSQLNNLCNAMMQAPEFQLF